MPASVRGVALNQSVTIDDVAAAAGVSIKTVSRVINGEPHVSERTRERVEQAIARLDYRPNVAARSLAASRTFLIGIISTHLEGAYFPALHRSAVGACRERGFHLVMEDPVLDGAQSLAALERDLRHMRYEGVLVTPSVADDKRVLDVLERSRIPYVRIMPSTSPERSGAVCIDEPHGMTLLAEHLLELGHRRIGLPSDPTDLLNRAITRRSERFVTAWLAAGGDSDDLRYAPLDWRDTVVNAGRRFARALLSDPDRPTAVFAFSDDIAAAVIGYAGEQGLRVPEQLAVAGFDDTDLARLVWPPLTTVRVDFDELARTAVAMLFEDAQGTAARRVSLPVELVVRRSTRPVAAG